jgi:RNA polymerase sigma-70 factor (ECF subfamily)
MEPEAAFRALLRRVRGGDAGAAAELVRQFEPEIRRAVRLRLTDPRYRHVHRLIDSVDICQSVLGSFFVRAALGQYELETPNDLVRLLVTMAYHKLIDQARKRANRLPVQGGAETLHNVREVGDTPSEIVGGQELLREFLGRMSPEERLLAELRAAGRSWTEIATRVGGSKEAVRQQLARAIKRVARQLGLDEGGSDG